MADPVTVFVPLDSAAVALGADEVAAAIASEAAKRKLAVKIIRNGSRGMHWLEPLVEVAVQGRRLGYGPVQAADVSGLFEAGFLTGGKHAEALGPVEEIPYLKNQERLTFKRCGIIDPLSIDDYRAHGGLIGVKRALSLGPKAIVEDVKASGLRGRGGAGFPAGIKWDTVLNTKADQKYVVCNADEGDSGTFADRMIMEGDPFTLIEGMTIAGLGVGATRGHVYLRSEYPIAVRVFEAALRKAREAGLLGSDILGSGKAFELELFVGAGAYICGEESSLLNSLEGKRGEVRARPPIPAEAGLFGKPTLLGNTISFCAVPTILGEGGAYYRNYGMGRSTGTMPFQLAGNIKHGGLVEKAFGITLRQLAEDFGGGTRSGRPLRAIQVGGPLGAYLPPQLFDLPMDYETFAAKGAGVGHGGIVLYDDTVNLASQARYAFEFCAHESCGKCTPCRIGATRGVEVMDKIMAGKDSAANLDLVRDLCELMVSGSLCQMGGMTPIPVMSAIEHFPEDFGSVGKD
jgi:formate dehydrogenase iron-sulfur subunit